MEQTIAAIATGSGEGGIGILRISGPRSLEIVKPMFKPRRLGAWDNPVSHQLILGECYDREQLLDQVMAVYMKGPHSFTGEDVVEIHCHGGYFVQERILDALIRGGAVPAQPGEFSRRAFLNGKLDLIQAESIIDVIQSTSDRGLALAAQHLQGGLSEEINELGDRLLTLIAHLEATLDFPEDEIDVLPEEDLTRTVEEIRDQLRDLTASYHQGKLVREGIRTVIAGKPNVGKSSLLNSLLRENRAIVTEIPGTTRDTIEELLNMDGMLLRIIDTAGIRDTEDAVERIGVDKSRASIEEADLVILLLDSTTGITPEDRDIERYLQNSGKPYFRVWNKQDLTPVPPEAGEIAISAREKHGFERLSAMIRTKVQLQEHHISRRTVTRKRHFMLLNQATEHLDAYLAGLEDGLPADFLSIDLRSAWEEVNQITGKHLTEDLFDRIFSEFCIGK